MTQQIINNGDSLLDVRTKINQNFAELFQILSELAPPPSPLSWLIQPEDKPYSVGEITFNYEYTKPSSLFSSGATWEYSDDGETWENTNEEQVSITSTTIDEMDYISGSLTIENPGTYVENRSYRVKVTVDSQNYYSNVVTIINN